MKKMKSYQLLGREQVSSFYESHLKPSPDSGRECLKRSEFPRERKPGREAAFFKTKVAVTSGQQTAPQPSFWKKQTVYHPQYVGTEGYQKAFLGG